MAAPGYVPASFSHVGGYGEILARAQKEQDPEKYINEFFERFKKNFGKKLRAWAKKTLDPYAYQVMLQQAQFVGLRTPNKPFTLMFKSQFPLMDSGKLLERSSYKILKSPDPDQIVRWGIPSDIMVKTGVRGDPKGFSRLVDVAAWVHGGRNIYRPKPRQWKVSPSTAKLFFQVFIAIMQRAGGTGKKSKDSDRYDKMRDWAVRSGSTVTGRAKELADAFRGSTNDAFVLYHIFRKVVGHEAGRSGYRTGGGGTVVFSMKARPWLLLTEVRLRAWFKDQAFQLLKKAWAATVAKEGDA